MIIQLLIDWIVISAISGGVLAFLAYRAVAQARSDGRVPIGDKGYLVPLPMDFNRLDDRVSGDGLFFETQRFHVKLKIRRAGLIKNAHMAATLTSPTGSTPMNSIANRTSQRSWARHASRV